MSKKGRKMDRRMADALDMELLELMVVGQTNRQIADKLNKPLSTIQRRTRILLERGLIKNTFELDYAKLGFKKGLLHVYIRNGNIPMIVQKISGIRGIVSVSVHLGNSDIVGEFVFKDSKEILDLISQTKKIEGVERTVWSEEVYSIPASLDNVVDLVLPGRK